MKAAEAKQPLEQSLKSKRKDTIKKYTGDADVKELPLTLNICPWWHFNVDFWSS